MVDTGNEGKGGVQEILKSGSLEKVLGDARIAREARLIDRLQEEIAKDGKASYGFKEVNNAVDSGAVDILLVVDKKLRENKKEVKVLIDKAKQAGSEFHVLNSDHEPGQKLDGFGGVAAILRFKV